MRLPWEIETPKSPPKKKRGIGWHVVYNALSNRSHPPTSPSIAPATANDSQDWSSWITHETSSTMLEASGVTQVLRLTQKITFQDISGIFWKRPKIHLHGVEPQECPSKITKHCACQIKMVLQDIKEHFWNGRNVISPKIDENWRCNLSATPPNSVPAPRSDSWTSPNIAPATRRLNVQLEKSFIKHFACHEKCAILWPHFSFTLLLFYSTFL